MEAIFNIDAHILLWIQEYVRSPILDPIMKGITHLGDGGAIWIALTVILLCVKRTRRAGIACAISMVIGLLVTNLVLKNWIARIRPYEVIQGLTILIGKPHDWSFPSGHTTNSFAAAWVMFTMLPQKFGVPALILAVLICFSRMYVGVHYPTDILGGIAVGCFAAWCACKAAKKLLPEK
ncbi:MAG: phosphatase PAP2 family protein [Clostridiales bacterium]|nr:phosphatase PAP2 family protein [Clostridiales bacterium]